MKRGVWTQIPGENAKKRWKERATSQVMPKICQRLGEKQEVALSLSPERASPAGALLSALQPPELCKHVLLIFKSPSLRSSPWWPPKRIQVLWEEIKHGYSCGSVQSNKRWEGLMGAEGKDSEKRVMKKRFRKQRPSKPL